jgi:hypothetical protein
MRLIPLGSSDSGRDGQEQASVIGKGVENPNLHPRVVQPGSVIAGAKWT